MTDELVTLGSDTPWPWPFGRSDLTAGMRRYMADTSLKVSEVRPLSIFRRRPSIGDVRGLQVDYHGQKGSGTCELVVKEPRGTTRIGLAGAGRREVGVYQFLAGQMPMIMPLMVAASPTGDWLILESVPPARDASEWTKDDYIKAIDSLANLHDRFWNLGEDLEAFPWLSRPLTADFGVHVTAASQSIEKISYRREPESLASNPEQMQLLRSLVSNAARIAEPLRGENRTLLHGDFWPGNVSILEEDSHVVFDWQLTAIGPAVLDLLVFIKKSTWWFTQMPLREGEIIDRYRSTLHASIGVNWEDEVWDELWDHALMWRFLQEWIDLLAASPEALLLASADQLDQVWMDPVRKAARKRLPGE